MGGLARTGEIVLARWHVASILRAMSHPLDGCRAKLERAWEHLHVLDNEITSFLSAFKEGEAYEIVTEIDEQERQEVRRMKVITPIPDVRWGVLTGDIVHNARSALEHVIEQATIAHHGSPLPRTDFPVFKDPLDYGRTTKKGGPAPGSGLYAIRGVSPQAAAIVEKLQPYQRGNDYARSPLWVLHELWNMDKHRLVAVVGMNALVPQTRFTTGLSGSGRTFEQAMMFPFQDGANLMRIGLLNGETESPVKVEMDLELAIVFGDGPADGYKVVEALNTCALFASAVVLNDFAPLFPDPPVGWTAPPP